MPIINVSIKHFATSAILTFYETAGQSVHLLDKKQVNKPYDLFTCFLFYLSALLQLLQLIHHATQHIEAALPEFRATDVNACIGQNFLRGFRPARR